MYSVGTVKVELDSASVLVVLLLIFPLSFSLTAYLMWIIISLNGELSTSHIMLTSGTIMHLQERKQTFKLRMFKRLYRILISAVIAVGAFFVLSSISLSNRLEEGYAPGNWRWRWVLLDASLALIYLVVFVSIAWLWRPTSNNRMFAMSTELAQDDADAEDYEIDDLEAQTGHVPLERSDSREYVHGEPPAYGDEDEEERKRLFTGHKGRRGTIGENDDNVVFSMGDLSDSEDDDDERTGALAGSSRPGGRNSTEGRYRDSDEGKSKAD